MSRSKYSILDDELREFCLEKDVKTTVKTQEEIEKATVDETLNDIERAIFVLSGGQEIQCISVIRNLPNLLKNWQSDCVQKVIPKLKDLLRTAGMDIQLVAAEIFTVIAKEKIFPAAAFSQYFLSIILKNINLKDPVAAQAWLTCLISAIAYLPKETIQKEILRLAISRGSLSKPVPIRLTSCALLGAVSGKFTSDLIKKEIIPTVKHLCQDIDFGVRACMSIHLLSVANALGAEETQKLILADILELAVDEEFPVQGAALDCLIRMRSLLDERTMKENVVPLICKYCQIAVECKASHVINVAENFGEFCHNISDYVTPEQRLQLLDIYGQLCKLGRPKVVAIGKERNAKRISESANERLSIDASVWVCLDHEARYTSCRRYCAYNFPALTLFCGVSSFESQLLDVLSLLCTDPDKTVRKYIAAGFHEIAHALEHCSSLIVPHVIFLLNETQSSDVLETFVTELPLILVSVVICGNLHEAKIEAVSGLSNAFLASVSQLKKNWPHEWRALSTLTSHFVVLPDIFSAELVYTNFVPVAFDLLLHNHYLPVRKSAATSLCTLLHRNRRYGQRKDICSRLVQDLGCSPCFRHRLMFFTVCYRILNLFSKAYFKDNFFPHLLKLFDDPVPNVRLSLCGLLLSMKAMLHLPSDRFLHSQFEINIRKLTCTETDRDVKAAVTAISAQLEQTKVPFELFTAHPIQEDRVKEDDERIVFEMEERRFDELARAEATRIHPRNSYTLFVSSPSTKGKGRDLSKSTHSLGSPASKSYDPKSPLSSPNQSRAGLKNKLSGTEQRLMPLNTPKTSVSATAGTYLSSQENKYRKSPASALSLPDKNGGVNETNEINLSSPNTPSTSTKKTVKSPTVLKWSEIFEKLEPGNIIYTVRPNAAFSPSAKLKIFRPKLRRSLWKRD